MVYVVLMGKIKSGKSTAAEILKKYKFTELTFSEPIKKFAESVGFDYKSLYGTQEEKLQINTRYNMSGREFMQKFGTDLCRESFEGIFIKALESKLSNVPTVISDCRFLDELEMLMKYSPITIRIISDRSQGSNHISETQLDNYFADYTIYNDSTVEYLEDRLVSILNIRRAPYAELFMLWFLLLANLTMIACIAEYMV